MATDSIIDIPALLNSIPGSQPAGVPTPTIVIQQIKEASRTTQKDPNTGESVERKPEWGKIITLTTEQLQTNSKDLLLAVRLTEALTKRYGAPGLRDGLRLIRELIENCWDRIHPIPNPEFGEGPEIRSDVIQHGLAERDYKSVFPFTVEQMPLVILEGKRYSLYDKKNIENGKGPISAAQFESADPLNKHIQEDLKQAMAELDLLDEAATAKLDTQAPNLLQLREVLQECLDFMQHLAGEEESPTPAEKAEAEEQPKQQQQSVNGRSPEELYRQLAHIASELEKIQPNNLAVALIRRAIKLGQMKPEQLLEELVRSPEALKESRREFGMEEPPKE